MPNKHRSKQPYLLPLAPTDFDSLTAPFDRSPKHWANYTCWTSACDDGEKVPRVQEMPSSTSKSIVCVACQQQFHVKCARETQLALQRLRAADAWTCHLCASVQRANNQPAAVHRKTDMPEQNKHRLTILQWNCDCLTTNVVELIELTVGYGIDIIALQETKLGRDDPTPVLNGFDSVRRDRPGSGARFARVGGLLTYI